MSHGIVCVQTANDFDPVLDAPAVRAYELAEGLLFGGKNRAGRFQIRLFSRNVKVANDVRTPGTYSGKRGRRATRYVHNHDK